MSQTTSAARTPWSPGDRGGGSLTMHPTLTRLERFAHCVAGAPGVLAVLGVGSAGLEHDRFDDHSDIDFFLVVEDDATKQTYLDGLDWLAGFGGTVTYSFANDPNGRKALVDDGLLLEYSVFTPAQLAALTLAGVRVVWHRAGVDPAALVTPAAVVTTSGHDTVEFHLNEALTNLFVGLHRHLRGERLTAMRFIQVYAVDRALALVRLTSATATAPPDQFDPTRRVERSGPHRALPLDDMVGGHARNVESATATLRWLTTTHRTDPVIVAAVEHLLAECGRRAGSSEGAGDRPDLA